MTQKTIKIAAVGDIALTHDYDVLLGVKGPHYPFDRIREVFSEHQIVIGNLESPLCLGGETYPMKLSLRAHPDYVMGLKDAGLTALSLGNNHILDYREKAFYDTLKILDSQGIQWCGAGKDLMEARRPVMMEKEGITVGMLSRCEVPIDSPFYASENFRGIAPLDLGQMERDIASLRGIADIIIASIHWGIEDWSYPSPDQTIKARRLIDMGAQLVIGHHPHVLQGVERYKNGCIAYSLGNFIFSDVDWRWVSSQGEVRRSQLRLNSARKKTVVFSAEVTKSGFHNIRMIPCKFGKDLRVTPLDKRDSYQMRMKVLSEPIRMKEYDTFWTYYNFIKARSEYAKVNARRLRNIHKVLLYPAKIFGTIMEKTRNTNVTRKPTISE